MNISDFLVHVLPGLPGCPTALAKQEVINAAIEFCRKSQAWVEIQDPVALVDDTREYSLDGVSGGRCIDIKNVWTINGELIPLTMNELAMRLPDWQTAEGSIPTFYTRAADYASIRVYPMPVDALSATITMRAVYVPTLTATTISDDLVNNYLETLAAGAKRRLMAMPGQTWSNEKLSAYYAQVEQRGTTAAQIEHLHDKTTGSVYVPPRSFG